MVPMAPMPPPTGAKGNGGGSGAQAAEAVREEAAQVASYAKEAGGQVVSEARGRARDEFDRRSTLMGERVSGTAHDLRDVAAGLRDKGNDSAARIADEAAQRIERVGGYLNETDMDRFGSDVRDFVSRRPAVVAAGAVVVGIVAGRLLKAGQPTRNGGGERHGR
jgi:hypothetical protein